MNNPTVSICCITYNHINFIRECLDGFILQKSNFDLEILIFDDASTDGTQEVIKEYAFKHKNILTFLQTENQWQKKKSGLLDFLFPNAKGKYIAFCEGDDYWTDPLKLQKQVDFLEANQDYSLCFTNSTIIFEGSDTTMPYLKYNESKELSAFNIIKGGGRVCPSASLVLRNYFKDDPFPDFLKTAMSGDRALAFFLLSKGRIYALNYFSCVYRKHQGGIFTSIKDDAAKRLIYAVSNIETLDSFDLYTSHKYKKEIKVAKSKISKSILLKLNNLGRLKSGYMMFRHLNLEDLLSFSSNFLKSFLKKIKN